MATNKPRKSKRKPDPRGTEVIYIRVPRATYEALEAAAAWPFTIAQLAGQAIAEKYPGHAKQ